MADDFTPRPNPEPRDPAFGLAGQTALVVGAGGVLGRAVAVALAEAGCGCGGRDAAGGHD